LWRLGKFAYRETSTRFLNRLNAPISRAGADVARIALLVVSAALVLPQAVLAQGPGFLFGQPRASVGVRMGYSFPAVSSELFDFSREQFTLGKGDFRSFYLGGEVAVRVADRVDLLGEFGWARSEPASEYRDWEDQNGLPIEQMTSFGRKSLIFGTRFYLADRGRSVGQFAWVPKRVAPFVGGGVGVMWHEFVQTGDFIDFQTLAVYQDRIRTSDTSATFDVRAGADFSLSRRVVLSGESRYSFGSAPTGGDYVGFDDLDLSGLTLMLGVSLRF
jgi:opacity protein-like surface antigen